MTNERTYPILPCADLDVSIAFYEALGFRRTYRQLRPNPCAVVALEDIHIHLFGMDGFDPATSYGSAIVVVPDPDSLYHAFATGLRAAYGKLPSAGIPRILRPRKRFGTVRGFSVVDPGGNWLRVSGSSELDSKPDEIPGNDPSFEPSDDGSTANVKGLAQFLLVAARLGDAHGDDAKALATIESGLARYTDAPAVDRVRAYAYRAELELRLGDDERARSSLAAAMAVALTDEERAAVAEEVAHVAEIIAEK